MATLLKKTETEDQASSNRFLSRKAPREVQMAFVFWLLAIGAALFEMVLAVTRMLMMGTGSIPGLLINIGLRVVIYGALVAIIIWMYRGKNWARITLAIGLGVIGTLSLVIDPIMWLAGGHTPGEALASMTVYSALFTMSRVVHLVSVWVGMVCMFLPAANWYFRTKKQGW
jgi:hypothetical protein